MTFLHLYYRSILHFKRRIFQLKPGIYILAISPPPLGGGKNFSKTEKQGRIKRGRGEKFCWLARIYTPDLSIKTKIKKKKSYDVKLLPIILVWPHYSIIFFYYQKDMDMEKSLKTKPQTRTY